MLMHFDPFREVSRDFDRLAQQVWGESRQPTMAMDAFRRGDRFTVLIDLPGVDPDSIELTVEKNVLSIKADRRWEPAEGDEVIAAERRQGTFSRQLLLSDVLDTDAINASYDNGVLKLEVPLAERARPRKVEVQTSSTGAKAIETESTEVSTGGKAATAA